MKPFPLDSLDVRSLRALHLLLETRSVTRSARRLGTSQPTVSRLLAGLRERFADPLLVPAGRGLTPTPLALALAPRIEAVLAAVHALLPPPPAAPPPHWHLAASDYSFTVVLRPWLADAAGAAQALTFHPVSLDTLGAVARGDVHLAIAPRVEARGAEALVFRPLLRDDHLVVMRQGHPASRAPLTLRRYLALRHVAVATGTPGRSLVERALAQGNHTREIALRVSNLTHALACVASTDLIATMPSRFVRAHAGAFVERPAPLAIAPQEVHLIFAPHLARDPAHRALRHELERVVEAPRYHAPP